MGQAILVLWVVYTIGVLIAYHKIFSVYYFNLTQGLMKELLISAFVGLMLAGLTLTYWWLAAIILLLVGLVASGKAETPSGKHTIIGFFVIAAIIISIVGIRYNSMLKEEEARVDVRVYALEEAAV